MSESQKKPGWAFWTSVALVAVLVGYPLSFGPAVWALRNLAPPQFIRNAADVLYTPLVHGADAVGATGILVWYLELWLGPGNPGAPA